MELDQYIAVENIAVGINATDKASAIAQMVGHASNVKSLNAEYITKLLLAREQKKSSGYGKQIAILHLIDRSIPEISVTIGTFKSPLQWDAVDGKLVTVAALILSPHRSVKEYIAVIPYVCKALAEDTVRASIVSMCTAAQVMTVLNSLKGKYA